MWSQFRPFLIHMHLVIHLHLIWYPANTIQVRTIRSLLTHITSLWFVPLMEKGFISAFQVCSTYIDSVMKTINELWRLQQGDYPSSTYTQYFHLSVMWYPLGQGSTAGSVSTRTLQLCERLASYVPWRL